MKQLFELTIAESSKLIESREISPGQLVNSLLKRIDAVDPQLKAWVYLDRESSLDQAKKQEQNIDNSRTLPPLYGVPVGLKDIYHNAGIPTVAGSKLYSDYIPEHDATTVARLKQAGAIILGKTVTTEFACGDPSPTVNPWNKAHTPGGSSSGSAVAVAARMCPAALGSQTLGSVLRPAAYNGVTGFKPTFGRVSRHGVVPVSWSLDTMGWMTRTVEDAAILLQVLAGPDPKDPMASNRIPPDYLNILKVRVPPRIGFLREYFYETADFETKQHMDNVLTLLTDAGASVEEFVVPENISEALGDQILIMAVEAAAFHKQMFRKRANDYQPKLREMIVRGLNTDAVSYSNAMERRQKFIFEMKGIVRQTDVLLTPSTPTPALEDLSNTGNGKFQGPWTSCGFPAISIPSGVSSLGLPLGVQLIGSPFAEVELFNSASWCEEAMNVNLSPPVLT